LRTVVAIVVVAVVVGALSAIYFCNRLLLFCLSLTFQCGTKHKTKPSKYSLSVRFQSFHQGQVVTALDRLRTDISGS